MGTRWGDRARRAPIPLLSQHVGRREYDVRTRPLSEGRHALIVVYADEITVVVSASTSPPDVALVARHAYEEHAPAWIDASWTVESCAESTCAVAQSWVPVVLEAAVSGL